jgi:succinoglycan biosynthesis protein ExoA
MTGTTTPFIPELPPLPSDVAVSVIIPARGAAEMLPGCLAAIVPQLASDDEVIVACADAETTATVMRLAELDQRIRVIDNPVGTTPAALNRAIAAARHPVVVRVDAQSRLPDGYRDRVVELLRETGAVNVGGRQIARADGGMAAAIATAMNMGLGHGGARYRSGSEGGPVDTVYLGAFRAEALAVVGGYDEAFLTNQDAELNERLRRARGRVWLDPSLEVGYLPRRSLTALARQFRAYGRGRVATVRRHAGSIRARQLAAPALVLILLLTAALAPVDPRPLLFVLLAYVVLLVLGVGLSAGDGRRRLPFVVAALVTMHLAWGTGFLTAWSRAMLARVTRRRGMA